MVTFKIMIVVYFFDIKAKIKSEYIRIKRRFYYYLNKYKTPNTYFKTKSVLVVDKKNEETFDILFKKFKDNIEVYKIYTDEIVEL